MKEIPLSRDKVAFVDDEDYEEISKYRWHTIKDGNTFYAARHITVAPYQEKLLMMHIEVLKMHGLHQKGKEVDHGDRNGLNNTKTNLRCVTHRENMENRCDNTQYPGVSKHTKSGKWRARARIGKKEYYLGLFTNPKDAYDARKKFLEEQEIS